MAVPNRNVCTRRRRIRRVLFWTGGNVLLFALTSAFIAGVGEVWLRMQWPFSHVGWPSHFVPKVGYMFVPNAEVRMTNRSDFWTISRTNSWGFPDREPIDPDRAAASCHIALIGDSFVAARQVPIADKLQVRLEALAARVLPELDITTSAFGIAATGQLNQLPLYDEFARRLHPKLLVLVFVSNDFTDNFAVLRSLMDRWDLDRMPWMFARRDADGRMRLLPPHPDAARYRWGTKPSRSFRWSYFATWLRRKLYRLGVFSFDLKKEGALRLHPGYESLLGGRQLTTEQLISVTNLASDVFNQKDLPPVFEAALDFTAFGLDQFKARADRDGVSLVILSTSDMGSRGDPAFDRLTALATARGIPVIDQTDYIRRQGFKRSKARWERDFHWNAAGHQWAAEAVLEYLEQNPAVCAQRPMVPDLTGP